MKSTKWHECKWKDCLYEGYTDHYHGLHHCMRCNRVVKIKGGEKNVKHR